MSIPFSRSLRALHADRFGAAGVVLALGALLLGAWGLWFVLAEVSVYAVTSSARLEADRAVHALDAPLSARVTAVHVRLGEAVETGDVLVELDAETQRLALEEARAARTALVTQRGALQRERASGGVALRQSTAAGSASLDETQALYEEANAAAEAAEAEADRRRQLFEKQYISDAEYEQAQAEARQRRAAAEALRLSLRRRSLDAAREGSDRQVRLDQNEREIARLDGDIAATRTTIERLEYELDQRQVRAPVPGIIGEMAELRVGAFVTAGDQLASIVPDGRVRAVAHFAPSTAVGRIQPGQSAALRLDGFPWTQYGSVPATVARVANEAQEGRVRVEFAVDEDANPAIPLQHGLPGSVEVEVERVSPAGLVLRNAGKLLRNQ